jgi:hypothetical protein
MAIFSPTIYYFGQPVTAASAGGFIIRPDAFASSVTVAIPGTQFGSTFGQTDYRSDISGYINGGTSLTNAQMPLTGSGQASSATTNFTADGYTTSMSRPNGTNMGATIGTLSNTDFGTGAFTIEGWMNPTSGTADMWMGNKYNAGWGFFGWSSAGYYRWVGQNAAFNEGLRDYTSTLTNGTWVHIFLSRSGSTWYGGVNGTIRGAFTFTNSGGATGTTAPHQICSWDAATQRPGVFQDYRVTKGVARYTGTAGTSYTIPQSIVTIG